MLINDGNARKSAEASGLTGLDNGWFRLKLPLPFSLRWVNSYLIPGRNRKFTVIDPGLNTEDARQTWEQALAELGLSWSDVSQVLLTHQHPDHYGLAGYMQQKSGAPVLMTKRSHRYAQRLWGEQSDYPAALQLLFRQHGMPADLVTAIRENLIGFVAMVSPQPQVDYIEVGGQIELDGAVWELLDAPGHAFGAICLYQKERRWMICGDQVLPRITPNISVVPGPEEEGDPLRYFLESLDALAGYEVELALPGHMDPFTGFHERLEELKGHHARRLETMLAMLREKPNSAFGLCEALFGDRLRSNPHNLRFAMGETLAHLVHLEATGLILATPDGAGVVRYNPT